MVKKYNYLKKIPDNKIKLKIMSTIPQNLLIVFNFDFNNLEKKELVNIIQTNKYQKISTKPAVKPRKIFVNISYL